MADNKSNRWRNIGICVVIVLGVVLVAQNYMKRGIQGRLASATDDIGGQYNNARGSLQYEPHYGEYRYQQGGTGVNVYGEYWGDTHPQQTSLSKAGAGGTVANINIPRKIIRNANLRLEVRDIYKAQAVINAIIARHNGQIVNSQVNKSPDSAGNGMIIFKVPPAELYKVLSEVKMQGEVQSENISGDDVTEQYVDLQARLQNYKKVKSRLEKILDERAREVKDILEVEREMARVGGDIESLEGKITYLDRQVDQSTVTVNIYEHQVAILKGLNVGDKFRETLRTSAETFVNTFNGVIIFLSFILPISIWLAVFGGVFMLVKKFFLKKKG